MLHSEKIIVGVRRYNAYDRAVLRSSTTIGGGDCEDWENDDMNIFYDQQFGAIFDNLREIKVLENKLKSGDCLKITDTCIGKIKNKKVFNVSFHKNQEELFQSFYSQEERKTLLLTVGRGIQLEVDVKGKILTIYLSTKGRD